MRRIHTVVFVVIPIVMMSVFLLSPLSASAYSRVTHSVQAPKIALTSACYSHPSAANCNGQGPDGTGCSADKQTKANQDIYYNGSPVGTVQVLYSPHCHTAWSNQYTAPSGTSRVQNQWYLEEAAYGCTGNILATQGSDPGPYGPYVTQQHSNMLYAGGGKCFDAYGQMDAGYVTYTSTVNLS
jgi:hypothetical protein